MVTQRRALGVVTPAELAPRMGLTPDIVQREKAHWLVERMGELEVYAGSVLKSCKHFLRGSVLSHSITGESCKATHVPSGDATGSPPSPIERVHAPSMCATPGDTVSPSGCAPIQMTSTPAGSGTPWYHFGRPTPRGRRDRYQVPPLNLTEPDRLESVQLEEQAQGTMVGDDVFYDSLPYPSGEDSLPTSPYPAIMATSQANMKDL